MATSGMMVRAAATATGIPERSVVVHMRNLREGGLVAPGGRGISARPMDAFDLSHLMLGLLGAAQVGDTVEAATNLGDLPLVGTPVAWPSGRGRRYPSNLSDLAAKNSRSDLQFVFATTLELHGRGMLMPKPTPFYTSNEGPTFLRLMDAPMFRLRVFAPIPLAILQYGNETRVETWTFGRVAAPLDRSGPFDEVLDRYSATVAQDPSAGGLIQVRELGTNSLEYLVDVLFDRCPDEI